MFIKVVKDKKDIKAFKKFRKDLYDNDPYYVSTIEFTCDMLLKKETLFSKTCDIVPLLVYDNDNIVAECLLIYNPKDDFVQISFFEALENMQEAVELIKKEARKFAEERNVKRVIVGLNGHLSYGVGLTVDIKSPNTFDSTYTKPYYIDYFKDGIIHNLVAFTSNIKEVIPNLKVKNTGFTIRPINLKKFKDEMELFRNICNETIGKTFLYSNADKYHFEELMSSMTFFLKPENILFAEDRGEVVGFIFWHPDYNAILKKGKYNSLLNIAVRYTLNKNKIKKVKLNSIGVKEEYQGIVTLQLLKETSKYLDKYETIETNFVWENNRKSMLINKRLLKNIERTFKVVEYIYMITIKEYNSILDVPKEWDNVIGDNIYMSIQFLTFMEKVDKCDQRYYMLYDNETLDSVFMTYIRPRYNMAMFTRFNIIQKMKMVYVPLSVTRPGIAYNKHLKEVFEYIKKIKGPKMILNLEDYNPEGYAKGKTCPKCILTNNFKSFDEYMNKLRSGYRRRYKQAFEKSKELKLEYLDNNEDFTEEMYNCYLQVYNKSRVRVEKLPIDFFRGKYFKIFKLTYLDKVVGFCQLLPNDTELIFEFVGVDYNYNDQFDTYHRILLEIVKYGIENNFKTIDFGQTADESKLKLGSKYTMLYAYLHDTNKIKNFINKKLARFIEYKPITQEFKVFKED